VIRRARNIMSGTQKRRSPSEETKEGERETNSPMGEDAKARAKLEGEQSQKKAADKLKRPWEREQTRVVKVEQEHQARWSEVRAYTMARVKRMSLDEEGYELEHGDADV
jgi:hypothetical protein